MFSVLPALGLLILLEIGARLTADAGLEAGGPLGWTASPGLVDYQVTQPPPMLSFTVSTNDDGLRTRYGRALAPGARRLVTFGDSTIFGWGLPAEAAPAGALEAALGRGWEVVNAGQPGFSSEQARRLAEAVLPLYEPTGVVWFHPWHDVARARASDRELLPAEPTWWQASALLSRLSTQKAALPRGNALFPFVPTLQDTGVPRVPPEERMENLTRVRDAAAAAGAWVVVALLPNDHTLNDAAPSPFSRELARSCADLGVPFVDTGEALRGRAVEEVTLPGDPGHFTAAANVALMAPVLAAIGQLEAR